MFGIHEDVLRAVLYVKKKKKLYYTVVLYNDRNSESISLLTGAIKMSQLILPKMYTCTYIIISKTF